jgi:hypothetical protein
VPTVPYQPVPDVAPRDIPTPSVHVQPVADAFGLGIAKAGEQLGRTTEQVGNELFSRAIALQQLQNETSAIEGATRASQAMSEKQAKFDEATRGNAGPEQLKQHIQDLAQTRAAIRATMPNDMVRRMYDSHTFSFFDRNVFAATRHSADETRKYHQEARDANDVQWRDTAAKDPSALPEATRAIAANHEVTSSIDGDSDEVKAVKLKNKVSQLYHDAVAGMAVDKPFEAKKLLDDTKGFFTAKDFESANKIATQSMYSKGAMQVALDVVHKPVDGKFEHTKDEYIDLGDKQAEKLMPGDPLMQEYTRRAVTAEYNRLQGVVKEANYANHNTIQRAINGDFGVAPTTTAELLAMGKSHPEIVAAWHNMDAIEQRPYIRQLGENASVGNREREAYERSDEGMFEKARLRGMAITNPDAFIKENITDSKLTNRTRGELLVDQKKALAKSEADVHGDATRIQGDFKQMFGAEMESLGLYRRDPNKPAAYDHMMGAIRDAVEIYRQTNGKPLTNPKEIRELGQKLLYQEHTPRRFWFDKVDEPVFMGKNVTEEFRKAYSAAVEKATGQIPSNESIYRAYVQYQLQQWAKTKGTPE